MPRYICERQDGKTDCGICCLLTIIKTYGGDISKEYLRLLSKTDRNGVNAFYLMHAAKMVGFDTQGVEGDFRLIESKRLPCIAHIIVNKSYCHFVVIHEIDLKEKRIVIADPAIGVRSLSFSEFDALSTSKYLLLEAVKLFVKPPKQTSLKEKVILLLKEYRYFLAFALFCSVVFTVGTIFFSFSYQFMLKEGIELSSKQNLLFLFGIFFLVALFIESGNYIRKKIVLWIQQQIDYSLFSSLVEHLFSLSYLYFKSRTTGEVLARVAEVNQLQEGLGQILLTSVLDLIFFLALTVSFLFLSPTLSIILGVCLFLLVFLSWVERFSFRSKIETFYGAQEEYHSTLTEALESIITIKDMQAESFTMMKTKTNYFRFLKEKKNLQEHLTFYSLLEEIIVKVSQLLLLLVGGILIIDGKLSFGVLLTCCQLSSYYFQTVGGLLNTLFQFELLKTSLRRVEELFYLPKELQELSQKDTGRKWKGDIAVRQLNYEYQPRKKIFHNFTLTLKQGDKLLLYGDSGCGKSTLAKILFRYIEVGRDMVFLNQKDIQDFSLLELREHISYLSQEERLFTGSIYDNIVLSRDVSYDEFLNVATMMGVDLISQRSSLGYDYLLEENGFNLSGGERQRILLARAMLKDASLYLLDESFSQIDVPSEKRILEQVFSYRKNSTFIVVSHRLSNQRLYQQIRNMGEKT